ncbi:alpha/beta-hydrolase [Mollisia scopiformis]|uniref:Alpha/beta-hydrolase n=1 Tax=Mollisia scopiformis TaxID=149040 RepID=A0A194X8K2_MOLSC|nr:alpha/beta-hydrolase [Mollisia scopiformis]KUJ16439.1 alpha/beta-hydrolase [Mollisia scopiformis]
MWQIVMTFEISLNSLRTSQGLSRDPKTPSYPAPLIIQPLLTRKQTLIILHGRGSTASKFSPPLLTTSSSSSGSTLQSSFPHAKVIFPTASLSRATIYKRSCTHQWFNNWHLEEYTKRQGMMVDGLRARENVVLWGLSQGCATALTALLTWDGPALGAVVGMCGYLPFGNVGERIGKGSKDQEPDPKKQAVTFLREELDMNVDAGETFLNIPVFLGHGAEDEKVSVNLGGEARRCLDLLGVEVEMIEYEGLGPWYSENMLRDIFQFLNTKLRSEKKS